MQIICTSIETDNHASASSLNFLQAECSFWRPTNSVKAQKECIYHQYKVIIYFLHNSNQQLLIFSSIYTTQKRAHNVLVVTWASIVQF